MEYVHFPTPFFKIDGCERSSVLEGGGDNLSKLTYNSTADVGQQQHV